MLRDGKLVQTEVRTGQSNSIYQQITGGLKEGDKVALQYNEVTAASRPKQEENPFMPKPPGSRKR